MNELDGFEARELIGTQKFTEREYSKDYFKYRTFEEDAIGGQDRNISCYKIDWGNLLVKKEDLISVIVPFFNNAAYLNMCIESILGQTYQELELILVDDGSTDGSREISEKYAALDSRVKLIKKNNQGPIAARYIALMSSCAEYIMFVDGDDWIRSDMCQTLMEILKKHQGEVITSGLYRYFSDANITQPELMIPEGVYDKPALIRNVYPCMLWDQKKQRPYGFEPSLCGKIFKKQMILQEYEKLKNNQFHYGEDSAITYPLLLETDVAVITSRAFYYHRQRKKHEVASYIKDEYYFEKLLSLYNYLHERFRVNKLSENLKMQLDYFYAYSVNLKKKCYQDQDMQNNYLFPFDKIDKGSKIILYGAGRVGYTYYKQLSALDYCTVVDWIDKFYEQCQDSPVDIHGIEALDSVTYDYIVVANANSLVKQEIIKELCAKKIPDNKIVY